MSDWSSIGVINAQNQFGEPVILNVNEEGSTLPLATTEALLTGYVSGAGVVADTDTVLEAIEKLNGNTEAAQTAAEDAQSTADAALPSADFDDAAVTGKLLTGLAAGSDESIAATDTILEALAKLQAQIDALA